jgi:ribA/ribD-fused uncharacterized protein
MPVQKASDFTFFFGKESPLSNWHHAPFSVKGIKFTDVEQFMMFCKAMLFKDDETAGKILSATHPSESKRLGREVKGFQQGVWVLYRERYVYRGALEKFRAHPGKKAFLISTQGTELVEASPYDRIWGVGLAADNPNILDKHKWLGANLLGEVLGRVREVCIEELKENK